MAFVVAALRRVWRPRPRSLRNHLVLLVVGAVLPVAIFSVFAVGRFAAEAKRGVEQHLLVTADGLAAALDKTPIGEASERRAERLQEIKHVRAVRRDQRDGPPAERDPARLEPRDEPAPAKPTRTRILVVEDNPDAREALRSLLEVAGHDVHEAADGEAGLRMAGELSPDIAIVDLGLPDIDGLAIARKLTTGAGPRPRLVALTGYGQSEDQHRAREAGFDEHLTKPVDRHRRHRVTSGASTPVHAPPAGSGV